MSTALVSAVLATVVAGFGVQLLLEFADGVLASLFGAGYAGQKDAWLRLLGAAMGVALTYAGNVTLLAQVGESSTDRTALVDHLVTGLLISTWAIAFNSAGKFLSYAVEQTKASVAVTAATAFRTPTIRQSANAMSLVSAGREPLVPAQATRIEPALVPSQGSESRASVLPTPSVKPTMTTRVDDKALIAPGSPSTKDVSAIVSPLRAVAPQQAIASVVDDEIAPSFRVPPPVRIEVLCLILAVSIFSVTNLLSWSATAGPTSHVAQSAIGVFGFMAIVVLFARELRNALLRNDLIRYMSRIDAELGILTDRSREQLTLLSQSNRFDPLLLIIWGLSGLIWLFGILAIRLHW
jgi:hypothetical protein